MASTIEVDQIKHSSGVAFTLPTADGSAGHVLKTNGSAVLSFTADTDTGIANVVEDTTPQLGGFLDANGNYIQMQKGGDIASASPTVIDTDGDYFICTGTTGFSAFTVAADRHFFLEFAGALVMTHGAGTLDLPGGANITTAASDVGEFVSTAANVVTCVNYTKASGKPVVTDFVNADINASAAIAQSKLVDIVNADVDASAAIATSKLSGAVTSIASHGLGALATLASVDTAQIAADAVTDAKIAADAVGASELKVTGNGTSGQYLGSDADGTFTWTSISSDPSMGGDMSGTASNAQIVANAVTATEIASNAVTTAKINADAVTGAKIADDAINSEHYAAASIDNEHLADDAVGVAELSATGTASSSTFLRGDNTWNTPSGGKVLQVVENNVNTTSSQSISTTMVNVSNLSATITPSSTSSKILVDVRVQAEPNNSSHETLYGIKRGSTIVGSAPAAGSRLVGIGSAWIGYHGDNNESIEGSNFQFIDAPSTTSATTYYVTAQSSSNGTLYNNRTINDSNNVNHERVTSTVRLWELESATVQTNGS